MSAEAIMALNKAKATPALMTLARTGPPTVRMKAGKGEALAISRPRSGAPTRTAITGTIWNTAARPSAQNTTAAILLGASRISSPR